MAKCLNPTASEQECWGPVCPFAHGFCVCVCVWNEIILQSILNISIINTNPIPKVLAGMSRESYPKKKSALIWTLSKTGIQIV